MNSNSDSDNFTYLENYIHKWILSLYGLFQNGDANLQFVGTLVAREYATRYRPFGRTCILQSDEKLLLLSPDEVISCVEYYNRTLTLTHHTLQFYFQTLYNHSLLDNFHVALWVNAFSITV